MTYDPSKLFFTDCETTGLSTARHDAWNIAWIEWDETTKDWREEVRYIWPPALQNAEPMALSVNQFYQRTQPVSIEDQIITWSDPRYVAEELAYASAGKHIVGACPWFDAGFYEKLLLAHGYCPAWHYHMIDVEALAIGFLGGRSMEQSTRTIELPLPWKSDWISDRLGLIRPGTKDRHTAIGDTREVKQVFEFIMGEHDINHWDFGLGPTPDLLIKETDAADPDS